jgi:hypothetical protein
MRKIWRVGQAPPVYASRCVHDSDRGGKTAREACALCSRPHSGYMPLTLPPCHAWTLDNGDYQAIIIVPCER